MPNGRRPGAGRQPRTGSIDTCGDQESAERLQPEVAVRSPAHVPQRSVQAASPLCRNRTTKMPISRNLNALPNKYLSTSPERDQATIDNLASRVPNPSWAWRRGRSLGTATVLGKTSFLTPYPQFTSVTTTSTRAGPRITACSSSSAERTPTA